MTKPISLFWVFAVVGCFSAIPVSGHHSFGAEYDANQPVTVTGVITRIEWTNPHSFIYLDVTDEKGHSANWKFEGYPPNVLYRTGWTKDATMKIGDSITISGWRARDGTNWAHSREVTLASGKKLFFGPPAGTGDGGNVPAVGVR
jgi:V8-like Glu-specific endopeptidase